MKVACFRIFGLMCLLGVVWCVLYYPFGPYSIGISLAVYAVVLWLSPHCWLLVLPALLPILSLYPSTGWLYIEEFDLAVCLTLAVGYLRAKSAAPRTRLTAAAKWSLGALAVSYASSALISASDVSQWEWLAVGSYNTPINGVRVLKGFAWPLFLLPLLRRAADDDQGAMLRRLAQGIVAGLIVASSVVAWERLAFPGFMNFSTDYRAVGSFFEAHVGGAAVDGYLALSFPFAAMYLLRARNILHAVLSFAVLLISTYAVLTTFSRGLYAGLAIAAAAGLALTIGRRLQRNNAVSLLFAAIATGAGLFLLVQVFASGGYRTLAASLGVVAAIFYAGAFRDAVRWPIALLIFAGSTALTLALVQFVAKGAYLAFALSAACMLGFASIERLRGTPYPAARFATSLWVAVNSIAVGWHWGGEPAMEDAALFATLAVGCALVNRQAESPHWSLSQRSITLLVLVGTCAALVIPVVGNFYMKSRVQTTSTDLKYRESHWSGTIAIRGDDLRTQLFGAGLGRYPERYFWNNMKDEFPGSIVYNREGDRFYARLGGARNTPDLIRLSQRIDAEPQQSLALTVDLRTPTNNARVIIEICEKWLIYTERCTNEPAVYNLKDNDWKRFSAQLQTKSLGHRFWWGSRPTVLTIAIDGDNAVADISDIALRRSDGRNLVGNSDFTRGGDRWFFTSDRSHLPWHAKNLWLGIWFDQGWIGVGAFLLLTALALAGIGNPDKPDYDMRTTIALALIAFFVVGLFDTLLDATRVAALFYLLCMIACLTVSVDPSARSVRSTRHRRRLGRRRSREIRSGDQTPDASATLSRSRAKS